MENIRYTADQLFNEGLDFKKRADYCGAFNCFSDAAPMYEDLAKQANDPKEKIEYLQKARACLQPLAVQTFMPNFINTNGSFAWHEVIKRLVKISSEIEELNKQANKIQK